MPPTIPTFVELREQAIADFQGRFPDWDLSPTSDNFKRLSVWVGVAWGLYRHNKISYDDLFPDTASWPGPLLRLGKIWGVEQKGATQARKSNALRVRGTVASAASAGEQLRSNAGVIYELGELATIPAGGYVDVDVKAVTAGSAGKLEAGEVLTFLSPPPGITQTAELQLAIDEDGVDAEGESSFRTRLLDRIAQPGMGGNVNDYRTWAESVTGVDRAFVYPNRRGYGSMDIAALHAGRGSVRALSESERAALLTVLQGLRPAGVRLLRVLETTTTLLGVDLTVEPGSQGYEFDWSDNGLSIEVASWDAGTRTLTLSADRPPGMFVGHRVCLRTASGLGSGDQLWIEDFGAGADEIILREAPLVAPVAGDDVFAGGPLVEPVRELLLAWFDLLGPGKGVYGEGDNWEDAVDPRRIESLAIGAAGVRRAIAVSPASLQTPTPTAYPTDTTVDYWSPGEILVRRLHA